jgi:hypothetical protein
MAATPTRETPPHPLLDRPRDDALADARLRGMLLQLRQTVVYPWESIDQVLRDHGASDLGDPATPGTGAWHLHHVVEILQSHCRVALKGLGADAEAVAAPVFAAPVPSDPELARGVLLAAIDAFITQVMAVPHAARTRRFHYGHDTDLEAMLACMTLHITWHAAAVHYWRRWRAPSK